MLRDLALATLPALEEALYRLKHPLWEYTPDDHPKRPQLEFHRSRAFCRLVYGGNQSGKTFSTTNEIVWFLRGIHPYQPVRRACRIYCLSASYRNVQEGVYRHLMDLLPKWEIEKYGPKIVGWDIASYIRMKNGAQIDFISGDGHEEARKKIASAAIDIAVVDEEIEDSLFREILPRLLRHDGRLIVAATLVNSKSWLVELEDRAKKGDPEVSLVRLSTYRAADCGHVSRKVLKQLESAYSEDERKVRLEGHSRASQGLVYPEFGTQNIITDPYTIPATHVRYCALDPGFRTFAVIWIAVGPDQHYVVYRELYYHGSNAYEVAEGILIAEGYVQTPGTHFWHAQTGQTETMAQRWIDPAGFGHHETGEIKVGGLLSQISQDMGVGNVLACSPANNDVQRGLAMCRRDLNIGINGLPKLRVFNSCENFIKEMRSYRYAQDTRSSGQAEPRDAPIKRKDHLMDAWRYCVLGGLSHFTTERQFHAPPFDASEGIDERMKKHFERLNAQAAVGSLQPQHPAGLGSEY